MIDLNRLNEQLKEPQKAPTFGEVHTIMDHLLISKGPICKIGDICLVGKGESAFEVIALKGNNVQLMPLQFSADVSIKDRVYVKPSSLQVPPHQYLLGRVINGIGEFVDEGFQYNHIPKESIDTKRKPINAMSRQRITNIMPTGVKAIDGLLTIGEGQRIGIFAGTGVGKSTLLGMIAQNAVADVNIIALIGERGREVKEFIEENLGEEGLKKSIVVVSTSDEAKLMNIKASELATSIAEKYRDEGKKVLLMMDSVTRFAMAKREIDLATGQLAPGGKTPSMETSMQRLLERAGMGKNGSITGIYTVLVEGDDMQGPIPDMARGILDGHIVLDRRIADMNQFPAINVLSSKSRVMDLIVSADHLKSSRELGKYLSIYKDNEDAFTFGAYERGRDKEVDFAKMVYPQIQEFLKQGKDENIAIEETIDAIKEMFL